MSALRPPAVLRPATGDLARGLGVAVACVVLTLFVNAQVPETPRDVDAPWVLALFVACLPTVLIRTAPRFAAVSALVLTLAGAAAGYPMAAALVVALALIGVTASRADVRLTGTLGVICGVVLGTFTVANADQDRWSVAAIGGFAVGILPALAGERLRSERARARDAQELALRVEELRDRDVARAVAEERLRIARDVHDITGHHLSAISLLAGGASRSTDDRDASDALRHIHDLAHDALGQTRRAVGVLSESAEPASLSPLPRLADVERLVENTRLAGITVELSVDGDRRDLSDTVELCAYRVLQESLTNVVRHAGARSVSVTLGYRAEVLEITVDDDGRGGAAVPGRGIEGMRARLALVGGELVAGPRPGGGWSVAAALPTEQPR
ncbi:Histidine kinase [Nocardioides terrae]|uniref:histidine kinase n=1 Tax=Nocardioides terrae TaxID=574651 RepID=A0A1I1DCQ4_9ACTN|nr:sensor histidine kinase [Nocardioides terrae]SFB72627.1 Histidine kinase [Nocardioides terrae]